MTAPTANSPQPAADARMGGPRRLLAAAALAALAALPTAAAEAQTATTFVSNTAATTSGWRQPDANIEQSQSFTTGSHAGGYNLSSVVLDADSVASLDTSFPVVATLTADSSSSPGTVVATLTTPATLVAGLNTFTAPANTTLAANTTYHVVLAHEGSGFQWTRVLLSSGVDSGAAAGWSIDNPHQTLTPPSPWTAPSTSAALAIQVRGTFANVPATGLAVTGSALEGQTLTAVTDGIDDADGLTSPTYSYQWQRMASGGAWTDISGATSSTYLLGSDDRGDRVRVRVRFTDDRGNDEELFSERSGWVGATDEPVVSLSVAAASVLGDGTNQVEFITSWTGSIGGSGTFGVAVDDPDDGVDAAAHEDTQPVEVMVPATGGQSFRYPTRMLPPGAPDRVVTFTLTDFGGYALAGHPLAVTATVTVTAPTAVTVAAKAASVVGTGNPAAEFTLTRTGDTAAALTVGVAVTGDVLDSSQNPTEATFTAGSATVEVSIPVNSLGVGDPSTSVTLTVQDGTGYGVGTGNAATVTVTAPPNTEPTGRPSVTGDARVGEELTAGLGDIMDPDDQPTLSDLTWQWQRETSTDTWVDIPGQTLQTYTLADDDEGLRVRVEASFPNVAIIFTETVPSEPTAAVVPAGAATGMPTFTGLGIVGQELMAEIGDVADADGLPAAADYNWRWQSKASGSAPWTDISGATEATYTLASGDNGRRVRVVVSFTDNEGNAEERASEGTFWVEAAAVPEVSVRAEAATVVGDGTNQVVFILDWTGNIATRGPLEYDLADPDDGVAGGTLEGSGLERGLTRATAPFRFGFPTQALSPGDADRVVTLTIRPNAGYTISGPSITVSATVTAPSPTEVTVAATPPSIVGVSGPTAAFTLTRTGDTAAALTVGVSVAGSGLGGSSPTEATFTAGSATVEVSVPVNSLGAGDASESVTLTVEPGTGYTVGAAPNNAATVTVTAPTDTPATGMPLVTGTARVGEELTAGIGDIIDPDDQPAESELSWQWQRETSTDTWEDIDENGTSQTYTLVPADEGLRVRVRAEFRDAINQETERLFSLPTAAVAAAGDPAPSDTPEPVNAPAEGELEVEASSVLAVGRTLTAAGIRTITDGDGLGALSYQWRRADDAGGTMNAMDIEGATSATYRPVAADEGKFLQVVVSFTDGGGTEESVESDWTAAVGPRPPNAAATGTLTVAGGGEPMVGRRLAAQLSDVVDADGLAGAVFGYQWQREVATGQPWQDIPGAVSTVYIPVEGDLWLPLRVVVTFEDQNENPERIESGPTAAVSPVPAGVVADRTAAVEGTLARFGGAVLTQVVDTVKLRLGAARTPGMRATFANRRVGGAPALSGGPAALDHRWAADDAPRTGLVSRALDGRGALAGSSFTVTGADGAGSGAVWGRGTHGSFASGDGGIDVDGTVTTGQVGADWSSGPMVIGVAVAHSIGDGEWRGASGSGETGTALTGVYPYLGYSLTERVSMWATGGLGEGTLEVRPDGLVPVETDIESTMAAAGLRSDVLATGGFGLAVRADAAVTRTTSEAVAGGAGSGLAASAADTRRVRLGLEASRPVSLDGGASLAPTVEVGVLHDGGDTAEGAGADVGVGVAWADPSRGLSAGLRGRALVAHQASGIREWGVSGEVRYDLGPSPRGLALSLAGGHGATAAGGVDALFALGMDDGLERGLEADGGALPGGRLEAEAGYGLGALGGRFASVPFAAAGLSDEGSGWRLGWRLEPAGPGAPELRPSVELHGGEDGRGVRLGLEAGF